jgi:NitT/TauT family transport system ATP-binding protein
VRRIVESAGVAILFITHDLEEAIYLGDQVIVLHANPGRVAASMEVDLASPRNQLTTREDPRFLAMRHAVYDLLGARH